ncbi:MAG: division/cell wall cluster transcriptional repressor MraZ [Alphaproteobacteria bacterium]
MALFIGTVVNKIDRKGRVSVPASFRAALAGQSFNGIVAFPSFKYRALDCCAFEFMEQMSLSLYDIDAFSNKQDDLAATVFADAHQIPLDSEGRVMLPAALLVHAGIKDMVAFVGQGPRFQIWEPAARDVFAAAARERANREGMTLKVRPPEGAGRSPGGGGES